MDWKSVGARVWSWVKFFAVQAWLCARWIYGKWAAIESKPLRMFVAGVAGIVLLAVVLALFTGCASSVDKPEVEPPCVGSY